jgi:hypothetical protein
MRSTFPSPSEVPCKRWSSLIATTDSHRSCFTASCFPNYTRGISLLKELLTGPSNVWFRNSFNGQQYGKIHLHSLFTLVSWIIAKLKLLFTTPGGYLAMSRPHSNTFQNGTAYPTDPLYNLVALHLILGLSASEWLVPRQTEKVTHQSFISGVDLCQTSRQLTCGTQSNTRSRGNLQSSPLAIFFFKPQRCNTALGSFVNYRSLQAKAFRFLSSQQLIYL